MKISVLKINTSSFFFFPVLRGCLDLSLLSEKWDSLISQLKLIGLRDGEQMSRLIVTINRALEPADTGCEFCLIYCWVSIFMGNHGALWLNIHLLAYRCLLQDVTFLTLPGCVSQGSVSPTNLVSFICKIGVMTMKINEMSHMLLDA